MAENRSLDDYPDIMTAALVAEMLDMNLDYVRKLSREGTIPAHKMPGGRVFRYFKEEVVTWLKDLPSHDQQGASSSTS
ncbi:helix-turn-helix domain-containing protein [Euzebya tangerina]|uniref:helix-turn-helix domain-containing protein n=1 Tax=Euzebya tangerina TaxID=591198 RepID=UPI000E311964|nr:helix-turn-helix domain-containing protein [Euzebya tangerina]